jgi:hypothetical protein
MADDDNLTALMKWMFEEVDRLTIKNDPDSVGFQAEHFLRSERVKELAQRHKVQLDDTQRNFLLDLTRILEDFGQTQNELARDDGKVQTFVAVAQKMQQLGLAEQ